MLEERKIGVISSGSIDRVNAIVLEDHINEPLLGRLVFFFHKEGKVAKLVIAQVSNIKLDNIWYQDSVLGSIIKNVGILPHISGFTDVKTMSLKILATYEVAVQVKETNKYYLDDEEVYKAIQSGTRLIQSSLFTPPSSGTYIYLLDDVVVDNVLKSTYHGYNIVYLGYIYGGTTPVPFNLSPFTNRSSEYKGLGEARMIGIFGQSGSGKSWLMAYLVAGFAKNKDMGILVLDPQGEFSNNFKTNMTKMPFHEMIKYACGRELVVVPTKDLRVDPDDTPMVAEFVTKFLQYNKVISTSSSKYLDVLNQLKSLIRSMSENNKWLNPAQVYSETMEAIYNNELDKIAKEFGTVDEASITKRIWERFIDQLKLVVRKLFSDQVAMAHVERLDMAKSDTLLLKKFARFLKLFDVRSGKTMNEVLSDLLERRAIVIIDLSNVGSMIEWMDEDEFIAFYIKMITDRLRSKAEEKYSSNELLDVLIAIDEAHRFLNDESGMKTEREELKRSIVRNVRETRKYGVGWLFATQRLAYFDKNVLSQLHDVFFLYGLGVGADAEHMKERMKDTEYLEIYYSMPNPKTTNNYWFAHVGTLSTLNTIDTVTFVRMPSPEEFLKLNFGTTLDDLKEKEEVARASLDW